MSGWCHAAACRAGVPAKPPSKWSSSSSNMVLSMTAAYPLRIQALCRKLLVPNILLACQSYGVVLSLASIQYRSASARTVSPSAKPICLKQQPGAERDSCVPAWSPSSSPEPLRRAHQHPRRPAAVRHKDCRTTQRLRSVTHTLRMATPEPALHVRGGAAEQRPEKGLEGGGCGHALCGPLQGHQDVRNPELTRLAGVSLTQAAAPGASGAIESYSGPDAAAPAAFMPLAPSAAYPYPVRSAHTSCKPMTHSHASACPCALQPCQPAHAC